MKKILLFLFLPLVCFAQYGSNINTDPGFDSPGSWLNTGDWTVSSSAAHPNGATGKMLYMANANVTTSTSFKAEVDITNYTSGYLSVRHSSTVYTPFTPTMNTNGHYVAEFTTTTTGYAYVILFAAQPATAHIFDVDNYIYRKKLVTIYLDPGGSDTAVGEIGTPILTPDECDTRGYYSGGAIVFNPGTYTGTLDPNNTVTITGSGATVAAINCGGNAVTLEGTDFTITTLTGSNITDNRTISDTGDKGYKETHKYKKFPDWR